MADSENKEKLSLGEKKPLRLGLKAPKEGAAPRGPAARAGGRGVQVEVKRKRNFARGSTAASEPVVKDAPVADEPAQASVVAEVAATAANEEAARQLSHTELEARARALAEASVVEEARQREEEEATRQRALEADRMRAENEAVQQQAVSEAAQRRAEEDKRKKLSDDEERGKVSEEASTRAAEEERARLSHIASLSSADLPDVAEEANRKTARGKPVARARGESRRGGRRLTVSEALTEPEQDRSRSIASIKRQRARAKALAKSRAEAPTKVYRDVIIPESITIADLANRMSERAVDVVKFLMKNDIMATVNQEVDAETAELVVSEFGHRPQRVLESDVEIGMLGEADDDTDLAPRSPVVTVMGHVDHGKTSLLDALRQSDVVSGEAGGITQHIGAYQVATAAGGKITYIDTPGHAAFTSMRQRGAKVTDIVILVVAADDGVMPQTIEAINHAKAAEVPIVVAINKMDRPNADPSRVKQELLQHEVISEDFGGDVQMIEVSALEKQNLGGLEEAILLQAEILELQANSDRSAEGIVIEAELDRGRGPVATVLVQKGTLRQGDIFVAGSEFGRARAVIDSYGENVSEAGPSVPVEVLGLSGTPRAGDDFVVVDSEAKAREISEYRQRRDRSVRAASSGPSTLEQMFSKIKEGEASELPIVIKSDVQGSMEAIAAAAEQMGTDEVKVRLLHIGVGGITESDVALATASGGLIFGFNVRANAQARDLAKRDGVDIFYYSIIYELIDQLKSMLSGMLAPQINMNIIGNAEILEVFSISKVGKIAGCRISHGQARAAAHARLVRDDVVMYDGPLASLKRFKDDVKEVREGQECGIGFENFHDLRVGDEFEIYEQEEVQRTL